MAFSSHWDNPRSSLHGKKSLISPYRQICLSPPSCLNPASLQARTAFRFPSPLPSSLSFSPFSFSFTIFSFSRVSFSPVSPQLQPILLLIPNILIRYSSAFPVCWHFFFFYLLSSTTIHLNILKKVHFWDFTSFLEGGRTCFAISIPENISVFHTF